MTYQKSPYPYILMLLCIIGFSLFSKITLDKAVDEPIVYSISKDKITSNQEQFLSKEQTEDMFLNQGTDNLALLD